MAEKIKSYDEMMKLIDSFALGRAPTGMKKEHEIITQIVKTNKFHKDMNVPTAFRTAAEKQHLDWFNQMDVGKIKEKFTAKGAEPQVVTGKYAEYSKAWPGAYKKFTDGIADLEKFFGTLSGMHAVPLPGLKVTFTNKINSIAKFLEREDVMAINPTKVWGSGEEYGSMRYVALHELGHRYLKKHRQNFDINNSMWTTTKYSGVDSLTGEERFAELFAMSHWPAKYTQYKDIMSKWKKLVK